MSTRTRLLSGKRASAGLQVPGPAGGQAQRPSMQAQIDNGRMIIGAVKAPAWLAGPAALLVPLPLPLPLCPLEAVR